MPPKATFSCTVLTTDAEWAAALKPDAEKGCLAVVECYAGWCGPADAATNTLTRMSVEMVGRRIKFFQANSTAISHLQKYAKSSRPAFLLYSPQGEQVEVIEGVNSPALIKAIEQYVPEGIVDEHVDEAPADETGDGDGDAF